MTDPRIDAPAEIKITVYVVEANVYSDRYVEGVYSSPEAAMAANPGGEWHLTEGEYRGERWRRWANDLDWDSARDIMAHVVHLPLAALPPDWCGHKTAVMLEQEAEAHEAEIARLRKIEEAARAALPLLSPHHPLRAALEAE